jgi:UDP-N-acetylglucosamine--N-acetylmuramyl-(pentapeptide) pyrophosphoryl-undecaprenol N-acetylglucosamine transferase
MNTATKKIMITGGHVTPAIAVIDEIFSEKPSWNMVFVGRMTAFEGGGSFVQEQTVVEQKGIRFIPITTGRIQRAFTMHTITSLIKIPFGLVQALSILKREKPDIVLSFGGYVAFPIVMAAALFRIPVVTHEQTRRPGLANRIISLLAHTVCVSFEDVNERFPKGKTVYTGLPVRKEFFLPSSKDMLAVPYTTYPIIYITGGSTGSTSMNALLFPLVDRLVKEYIVIHQMGYQSATSGELVKHSLPYKTKDRYVIRDNFDAKTTAWIMQKASLVIGRAGANTVMELALLQKKTILIPLPWAGEGEQKENARWLQKFGFGAIIDQRVTTSELIYQQILLILKQPKSTTQGYTLRRDGAKQVVRQLDLILK